MIQTVKVMREVGVKTYVIFAMSIFMTGCGGQEEGDNKGELSTEVDEPVPDNEKAFPIDDFCAFVVDDRPSLKEARGYVVDWQENVRRLTKEEYRDVLMSSCFKSRFLMDPVYDLCDCINEYGQVSIECDHIQEKIHFNYSEAEEEAIEQIFIDLNCLDE